MGEPLHLEQKNTLLVKAGTRLIAENEMSQKMYVIQKGKARVYKTYLGQRITLAVLGSGEIFGEMSFVDAQPRSASVEAVTDMEVIAIDGAKGSEQLESLPNWVWSIFRTVFYRFRELDREIIALHCAVAYRKKGMKENIVASTIYLELVRFVKILYLVMRNRTQQKKSLSPKDILAELDEVLGNRAIALKSFWSLIQEYDFLDPIELEKNDVVKMVEERFDRFSEYLMSEIKKERYLMMSHGALSIIRKILTLISTQSHGDDSLIRFKVNAQELQVTNVPGYEAAMEEIEKYQLISLKDGVFDVEPKEIHELYIFHSIIKTFDHSSIYVD